MHYQHKHGCACGGSSCDQNMLNRLSTVVEPLSILQGDFGIDAKKAADLTGLGRDTVVLAGNYVWRNGVAFAR